MILKELDSRVADMKTLRDLSREVSTTHRHKVVRELHNLDTGMKGEATVAHYLRREFVDDPDVIVINDLRLAHGGEHAQTDHLIMDRISGVVWVVETKAYRGTMSCDRHGDWMVTYGSTPYAVDPPIRQARRHCTALAAWFGRMGVAPGMIEPVVLVSPETILERQDIPPDVPVMKSDAFTEWLSDKRQRNRGPARLSADEFLRLGTALLADHQPKPVENWRWKLRIPRQNTVGDEPSMPVRKVTGSKVRKSKSDGARGSFGAIAGLVLLALWGMGVLPWSAKRHASSPVTPTVVHERATPIIGAVPPRQLSRAVSPPEESQSTTPRNGGEVLPRRNGAFIRTLPLQGKIAQVGFENRSASDAVVNWRYDLHDGQGERMAMTAYVVAGQSVAIEIPAFDYRMTISKASMTYRGSAALGREIDLGYIDLKTPASSLTRQPVATYRDYGPFQIQPGVLSYPRR